MKAYRDLGRVASVPESSGFAERRFSLPTNLKSNVGGSTQLPPVPEQTSKPIAKAFPKGKRDSKGAFTPINPLSYHGAKPKNYPPVPASVSRALSSVSG